MTTRNWRDLTPSEVLDGWPVLTQTQVAYVLGLVFVRGKYMGEPNRRRALELINDGTLATVGGQTGPMATVSADVVRAYMQPAADPPARLTVVGADGGAAA